MSPTTAALWRSEFCPVLVRLARSSSITFLALSRTAGIGHVDGQQLAGTMRPTRSRLGTENRPTRIGGTDGQNRQREQLVLPTVVEMVTHWR